jgi:hypothetical protein
MVMAMRVVGDNEGKGGKAMAMATRMVGKGTAVAMKRTMLAATREAGKEEMNGKDDMSNGDGKEDSNGK